MTNDERSILQEIQGSRGWKLIELLIQKKVDSLDSVMDIDGRSEARAGIEALARKKAVLLLREFLNDMGLTQSLKDTNQTYE